MKTIEFRNIFIVFFLILNKRDISVQCMVEIEVAYASLLLKEKDF